MSEDERVQLEIWSDVACPWCYLGRRNLQVALVDVDELDRPELTWRAYQLDPSIPAEGVDADVYFAARFPDPEVIREAQERLTVLGEDIGITFRFDRQRTIANTHLAHQVIAAARVIGLHEQVIDAIFAANFERGIDIGDAAALREVVADAVDDERLAEEIVAGAQNHPELAELVDRDIALARQLDITGVPCFVADRRIAVPGAVPPPILAQLIERAVNDRRAARDLVDEDD